MWLINEYMIGNVAAVVTEALDCCGTLYHSNRLLNKLHGGLLSRGADLKPESYIAAHFSPASEGRKMPSDGQDPTM